MLKFCGFSNALFPRDGYRVPLCLFIRMYVARVKCSDLRGTRKDPGCIVPTVAFGDASSIREHRFERGTKETKARLLFHEFLFSFAFDVTEMFEPFAPSRRIRAPLDRWSFDILAPADKRRKARTTDSARLFSAIRTARDPSPRAGVNRETLSKEEKQSTPNRNEEATKHVHRRVRSAVFTDSPLNWMFSGGDKTGAGRRVKREGRPDKNVEIRGPRRGGRIISDSARLAEFSSTFHSPLPRARDRKSVV